MKKTFFYNIIPGKAEEEFYKSMNIQRQVSRCLVEVRDVHTPPVLDFKNPWKITKNLTQFEIETGKIILSFIDTFDHIFRYWVYSKAKHVVMGYDVYVTLWDVTNHNKPKRYQTKNVYLEILYNDDYALSCGDLLKDHKLNVDDEIGIFWDPRNSTFQFTLFPSLIPKLPLEESKTEAPSPTPTRDPTEVPHPPTQVVAPLVIETPTPPSTMDAIGE